MTNRYFILSKTEYYSHSRQRISLPTYPKVGGKKEKQQNECDIYQPVNEVKKE